MNMILTRGHAIDFLRVNQSIQDADKKNWIKIIHKTTPKKPALCFFFPIKLPFYKCHMPRMPTNMTVKATHSNREFNMKGLSEKP